MRHLLLLPLLFATAQANNLPLETWLKKQATVTSLDAPFTQERRLPALKAPITTRGRLCFAKPSKFRWQLGEPFVTLAVSDGTLLTLVDATTKTARQIPSDSPQAARFAMLSGKAFESVELFYQTFEIAEYRQDSGIHQYTLKAKERRMRSQIPWIFLDIDSEKNQLRAMEMELQDKSRIRTVFLEPSFNTKLDPALFTPNLTGYTMK